MLEPSWLSQPSRALQAVRAMGEAQAALAARQARRMDMNTTDMKALSLLDTHDSLGLTELARHLDLRPASVTSLIDRLEAAGMIERVREGNDRRRITVRALPKARERSYAAWSPVLQAMDDAGHALSAEEEQTVCSYLDHITAVMWAAAEE